LLQELFYVFTMLALAQLWNLLAGCAGLISVGQQAFVGIGAYALFAFTLMADLEPVLSIVLAGIVAGVIALPAALIVFRLRGAYFAIGTWVVAEVCRLVLAQFKQLGGGTGTYCHRTSSIPLSVWTLSATFSRSAAPRRATSWPIGWLSFWRSARSF
jgi:branched-chain amino acid transport system permease protein